TTGNCSPTALSASSRWRTRASGSTAVASRPTRKPAGTATSASMSCAAPRMRNTRRSSSASGGPARRRPITTRWLRGCRPRRPGSKGSKMRARPNWRRENRTSGCGCAAAGPESAPSSARTWSCRASPGRSPPRSGTASGSRCSAPTGPASPRSCGCSAGSSLRTEGEPALGARVVRGLSVKTHARPDLADRWPEEILMTEHALLRSEAMAALARYEIQFSARQPFRTLSGGQQARLQILLLELAGSTLLLLDEPTDNLDLSSAEALQEGMESYQGTVLAVTHDRWFARSFDRFLVFRADGNVQEYDSPVWDETRPVRPH